jgi:hypothetical protein
MPNLPTPWSVPVPETRQPASYAPMAPVAAPPPQLQMPEYKGPSQSDELGGIARAAMSLATQDDKKKPGSFDDFMKNIDSQISSMKMDRDRLMKLLAGQNGQDSQARYTGGAPADIDAYMAKNAAFESGNNPDATNPGSGATGLFQFLPSTWRSIMQEAPELGLTEEGIKNGDQQIKAMRYFTGKHAQALTSMLGRKPTGGELYLLHLLGQGGGSAVLKDLDSPITSTISGGAYAGNPFLKQYKTGHDLIAGLNQRFGG